MDDHDNVARAITALQDGKLIMVQGTLHGIHVATLVRDAQRVGPDDINFMATYGRGLVSCAVDESQLRRLDIPVIRSTVPGATAFCVSVDAKLGTTTGISAADRAITARLLAHATAEAKDFSRPGHLFPIKVSRGRLPETLNLADAALELAILAGGARAALTCPILSPEGEVAGESYCEQFSRHHRLTRLTVEELARFLSQRPSGLAQAL